MTGRPPCARMSSISTCEDLTSKTTLAPGWRTRRSRASRASSRSASWRRPRSSIDPDPIRVAVVGEPDVGSDLVDLGHEVAHVLLHLRIRADDWGNCRRTRSTARPPRSRGGAAARGRRLPAMPLPASTTTLRRRPSRTWPVIAPEVLLTGVAGGATSAAALEVAGPDRGEEALDLVLAQRRGRRVHHLDPVVGDRVVAPGHGGAAVEPPVGDREVEQGRVVDPDVDHVDARWRGRRSRRRP